MIEGNEAVDDGLPRKDVAQDDEIVSGIRHMGFDPLSRKGILKRMCYHGADLVEGLRTVDISFAYRHYLIPRRSLKNALTEKGSGY
jgi:hypothetical protein